MGHVHRLSAEQVLRDSGPAGDAFTPRFSDPNARDPGTIRFSSAQVPEPRRPLRRLLCAVRSLTSGDWRPSHAAVRDVFHDIAAHGEHSDRRAWADAAPEAPLPLLARGVERLVAVAAEAGGELEVCAAEALSAALDALSSAAQTLMPLLLDDVERQTTLTASALHAQQLVECGWLSTAAGLLAGALAERRCGAGRSVLLQLPPGTGHVLEQIVLAAARPSALLEILPPGHQLRRLLVEALTDSDLPALAVEAAWEFRGERANLDVLPYWPLAIVQTWMCSAASDGGPAAAASGWFGRHAAITARLEALAPTLRQLLPLVLSNACGFARHMTLIEVGRQLLVQTAPNEGPPPAHGPLVRHLPPLPLCQPQGWTLQTGCIPPLHIAVDAARWSAKVAGLDLVADSAAWLLIFEACLHLSEIGTYMSANKQWLGGALYAQTAVELLARLPPREAAAAAAALEPLLAADLAGGLVTAHLLARAHAALLPDRLVAAALPAVEARVRERARSRGDDPPLVGAGVALLWAFAQRATGPAAGSAASGPAVTALKALRALSHLGHAAGALEAAQCFGRARGCLDPAFQAAFDVRLEELRARRPLGGGSAAGSQGGRAAAAAPAPAAAPALLLPPGLLPACANPDCSNLEGPSEAALPTKRCRGCLTLRYCGAACQTADWPRHRARCKELRTAGAAAAAPSGASGSGGAAAE
ncbi:hypothetical protein Rsub_10601 [Raphidocelis subcapitata]|uniref:phytol kinase n=1 Tax=Raphidocelis subcapitata TaxID=307507 RepID=A0A2V0PDJ6_9CHLO|nr:hypothetical protein Rsub_10601 [Raphidocelis subcapitata]|eukprot:GBF97928.1 hypothetical protein Rsub_10601 [Raphidocelis subcapitata]